MIFRVSYAVSVVTFIITAALFQPVCLAKPVLVFNVTGQPPLNTEMQNGFMDEVAREAMQRIGYELVIIRLPAERGLRNANSGLIDGEMSRIAGIERTYQNLIQVPEKIMDWGFFVFSAKSPDLQQGWQSLNKLNIAFITGWKILENNVPKTAAITKAKNSQQLFLLLKKKRTEFVIYEQWAGNSLIKQLQMNDVSRREPALAKKEMFMYLHKKHKDLAPKLAAALAEMKRDGSYSRLEQKHLK